MQFTPWYELYEKYKDEIPNKEEFFRKWQEDHSKFIEKSSTMDPKNIKIEEKLKPLAK